ncbi:MAG: ABC transporter permease [Bacilli bacterium]|nr:ABC transporter permease [Bacilli bacterium]
MVKKCLAKGAIFLTLFLMYLPILVLIVFSFTDSKNIGVWNGFSFNLYVSLFKNKEILQVTLNTIIVALSSALVATILGSLGAIGIFYSKRRTKRVMDFAGQIPIMNAEIVTALSLTILFVFVGAKFNFLTLLIGHVVLTVPFVVLSVMPKLKQMDPNTYEAALDLGATPTYALWKVIIPEIIPGIISGFMLAVTLSLDDYIITAFTKNDSFQTLSTYIYGVTSKKGSLPPQLRALTTIIFLIILGVLFIVNFRHKKESKGGNR